METLGHINTDDGWKFKFTEDTLAEENALLLKIREDISEPGKATSSGSER